MKLAILVSGHIRSLEYANGNLVQLKKKFPKADIYLHTWSTTEMVNPTHQTPGHDIHDSKDFGFNNFELKKLLIEDQSEIHIPFHVEEAIKKLSSQIQGSAIGFFWMIYGIRKVTEMMSLHESLENFKYDLVLRYRFDLIIDSLDSLEKDMYSMIIDDRDFLMTTNQNWWPLGCYSDVVWVAKRGAHLGLINNLYKSIDLQIIQFQKSITFLPELILKKVIVSLNLKVELLGGIFSLKRANYDERISRLRSVARVELETLAYCWTHLRINFKDDGFWVRPKNNILRMEWNKNAYFLFRSLNLTRILYFIYRIYRRTFLIRT